MKSALIDLLKWMFVASTIMTSLFSMQVFGTGLWSFVFLGIAIVVVLSIWIKKLIPLGVLLARIAGVLSVLALGLLMLAATTGGSFNLSESNQQFAMMLVLLSVFGLSAFAWPGMGVKKKE